MPWAPPRPWAVSYTHLDVYKRQPYNGGIGYGDKKAPPIADLSNTSLALEAIYYSQKLAKDGKYGEQPDLDWNAATEFINRCQQNPAVNKEPWVSSDKSQLGGFVYRPGVASARDSKSAAFDKAEPPRAYGLSLIHIWPWTAATRSSS